MEIKRFSEWITLKEKIHTKERIPRIKEGEVWWLAIGENVGIEINGKSEYFSRPVLVFKKLSYLGFMGIPLSTQKHEGSWYVNFRFQDKNICAALAQARTLSTARLYTRLGQIAEDDMEIIKKGFQKLYL
ncbi:type II toxin-antitoxin system PemK/MazF family toxin [Candidatus Saccharibacteria bacterium]|nr:type II toxin-antitoxin system PemK/MazF family toxin [Candidatus Saccharibacteria bacterium]